MKIKEKVLKGCGLKESLGSPICQEDCLCNDCNQQLKGINKTLAEVGKVLEEIPYGVILRLRKGDYIEDAEVDGCKEKVLMYIIEEELKQKLGIK